MIVMCEDKPKFSESDVKRVIRKITSEIKCVRKYPERYLMNSPQDYEAGLKAARAWINEELK